MLPGGGAPEMLMAQAVEEESKRVASKRVVAITRDYPRLPEITDD